MATERWYKRTVFLDKIPFPAAIAVGFDGLWLGAPPTLLFVPDRNHDDKADALRSASGLGHPRPPRDPQQPQLGPHGWLYGCQGFATTSRVVATLDGGKVYRPGDPFPESSKSRIRSLSTAASGVTTEDRFEVVAHGFSNPWGLDFDDHGQMFITACVIPHLWHAVPGGFYHRSGWQTHQPLHLRRHQNHRRPPPPLRPWRSPHSNT